MEIDTILHRNQKAIDFYGEAVINKNLIQKAGFSSRAIPTYVGEWILYNFLEDGELTEESRGKYDLVVLDEVQSVQGDNAGELIAGLKVYLEAGKFSRGNTEATAFIDKIHGIIPGWKMQRISKDPRLHI